MVLRELSSTATASCPASRAVSVLCLVAVSGCMQGCMQFQQKPTTKFGTESFITVGDRGKVYVKDTGHGPAVLLIHGFAGAHDHWAPIQPALTRAGFRVVSIDLPGSGRSDKYPGDYSPSALGKTLFEVLDLLGIERAHVAGHSWGTSIALAMALDVPRRVLSVTLIGSWAYEDQMAPFITWSRAPLLGEFLFWMYIDEFLDERMALTFFDPDFYAAQPALVERARRQLKNPGFMAASLAAARAMRYAELQKRYSKLRQRTLLIHGAHDPITRLPWARRLHGEIADSRLVIIDRTCHMPQLEQPAKVLRAMLPFLQGLEPNQAPMVASRRPAGAAPAQPDADQTPPPHSAPAGDDNAKPDKPRPGAPATHPAADEVRR